MASVVIPVRDRRDDLARALASLRRQRTGDEAGFEVVVVDDGSTDGTWELLQELAAEAPSARGYGLVPLRRDAPAGAAQGRNLAGAHARGEVLLFLDSDCVARERWLEAMLRPLANDPGVGVVGGAEVPDPAEGLFARVVDFTLTSFLTTGGVRGRAGTKAGRYRPRSFSMAIRASLFRELGGYRPLFRGEDIDLSERAHQAGWRLAFAPGAEVYHHRRKTPSAFLRQVFQNGRSRGSLIRLDRRHAEPIYFVPVALVGILAAAVVTARGGAPRVGLAALGLGGAYLALVGLAAATALRNPGALLLAPFAFGLEQAGYAAGLVAGLVAPYAAD